MRGMQAVETSARAEDLLDPFTELDPPVFSLPQNGRKLTALPAVVCWLRLARKPLGEIRKRPGCVTACTRQSPGRVEPTLWSV